MYSITVYGDMGCTEFRVQTIYTLTLYSFIRIGKWRSLVSSQCQPFHVWFALVSLWISLRVSVKPPVGRKFIAFLTVQMIKIHATSQVAVSFLYRFEDLCTWNWLLTGVSWDWSKYENFASRICLFTWLPDLYQMKSYVYLGKFTLVISYEWEQFRIVWKFRWQ